MRISVWSSDVCSSDLNRVLAWAMRQSMRRVTRGQGEAFTHRRLDSTASDVSFSTVRRVPSAYLESTSICTTRVKNSASVPHSAEYGSIGRASCRERVCQYV